MTRTSCADKVVFANMFMYAKKMDLIRGKQLYLQLIINHEDKQSNTLP